MPIVINEVEILDSPPTTAATPTRPAKHGEPAYEQLRRLTRDLEARARRLTAD